MLNHATPSFVRAGFGKMRRATVAVLVATSLTAMMGFVAIAIKQVRHPFDQARINELAESPEEILSSLLGWLLIGFPVARGDRVIPSHPRIAFRLKPQMVNFPCSPTALARTSGR